jgi:hypothetical protein
MRVLMDFCFSCFVSAAIADGTFSFSSATGDCAPCKP